MSVMHFANALVWEIIGPAMAGPTGPCATPLSPRLNIDRTLFQALAVMVQPDAVSSATAAASNS